MNRWNTAEKSMEILAKILELCNTGHEVGFSEDWGGNSLTLYIDEQHTHCGDDEGTFEDLIADLHGVLVKGKGLSFA